MKTILKSVVLAAIATILSVGLFSCEEETNQYMYDITVSDDTSTGSYMSYKASGAEATILAEAEKVGIRVDKENTYVLVTGSKESKCNDAIKKAVNAGMDKVEAEEGYNSVFDLSETTVVVKLSDKVVYSRQFKK